MRDFFAKNVFEKSVVIKKKNLKNKNIFAKDGIFDAKGRFLVI